MNIKVVSSLLISVLAGVYASTSPTPTATTTSTSTTATATGSGAGAAESGPKPQVFMKLVMRVGPIDMDALAGGRLQPTPTTSNTTPSTAAKQHKWSPAPGQLYRAQDDPSIKDLLAFGSPSDNAKFETEAAFLYRARDDRSDPKIAERRAWFKAEKQRRRERLNKSNERKSKKTSASTAPTASTAASSPPPTTAPTTAPTAVATPVQQAAPAPAPAQQAAPAPVQQAAPKQAQSKMGAAMGIFNKAKGIAANKFGGRK